MKKEAKLLLDRATDSLTLAVELFNRPSNVGRPEAVLILLDHSFEMLLKAAIIHRGGRIRRPRESETLTLRECVRVGHSNGNLKFLSDGQALLLQAINGHRGAAQHHLVDLPEGMLYLHAQGGLTLFRDVFRAVFGEELSTLLPDRVLPLSTTPPLDLATLFDQEVAEVRRLLAPHRRRRTEALARLRPLAILNAAVSGESSSIADRELGRQARELLTGTSWEDVFPGAAGIDITSSGTGPSIAFRITKKEGIPIQLVQEGSPDAAVVAVRRVGELDYYSLGHRDLSVHCDISQNRLTAVIWFTDLKSNDAAAKEFAIGRSRFWRYSQEAERIVRAAIDEEGILPIWEAYRGSQRGDRPPTAA